MEPTSKPTRRSLSCPRLSNTQEHTVEACSDFLQRNGHRSLSLRPQIPFRITSHKCPLVCSDRRPPFGSEYVSTSSFWFGVRIDVLLLAQSTYRRPPFGSEYVSTSSFWFGVRIDVLLLVRSTYRRLPFGSECVSTSSCWLGVRIDVLLLARSTYRRSAFGSEYVSTSSFWLGVRSDGRPPFWLGVCIAGCPPLGSEYVSTDVLLLARSTYRQTSSVWF